MYIHPYTYGRNFVRGGGGQNKFAQIFNIKLRRAHMCEFLNKKIIITVMVALLYFINWLYIYNVP